MQFRSPRAMSGSRRPGERSHAFGGDLGLIGSDQLMVWGGCPLYPPAILQEGLRRACLGDVAVTRDAPQCRTSCFFTPPFAARVWSFLKRIDAAEAETCQ